MRERSCRATIVALQQQYCNIPRFKLKRTVFNRLRDRSNTGGSLRSRKLKLKNRRLAHLESLPQQKVLLGERFRRVSSKYERKRSVNMSDGRPIRSP